MPSTTFECIQYLQLIKDVIIAQEVLAIYADKLLSMESQTYYITNTFLGDSWASTLPLNNIKWCTAAPRRKQTVFDTLTGCYM